MDVNYETIIKYLEAVKVLISKNSDMEDIVACRDRYYGEEDKIQKCIDFLKETSGR